MTEDYAAGWMTKAKIRSETGILDDMVSKELFDHTWISSIRQIEGHLDIRDGQRILDAGCGWGRLVFGLKHFHPSLAIDGYELTNQFVAKAREILKKADLDDGVTITQGNLLEIDLPEGTYDAFYSSRVLHYIDDKKRVVEKLYASLKEGGRGMIILPNSRCFYRWFTYKHAPLYPIRSVGEILKSVGFKDVYCGGYGFVPATMRFSHDSMVASFNDRLSATPLGRFGGLAFAVGRK